MQLIFTLLQNREKMAKKLTGENLLTNSRPPKPTNGDAQLELDQLAEQ